LQAQNTILFSGKQKLKQCFPRVFREHKRSKFCAKNTEQIDNGFKNIMKNKKSKLKYRIYKRKKLRTTAIAWQKIRSLRKKVAIVVCFFIYFFRLLFILFITCSLNTAIVTVIVVAVVVVVVVVQLQISQSCLKPFLGLSSVMQKWDIRGIWEQRKR
jgi:hypothetical protein